MAWVKSFRAAVRLRLQITLTLATDYAISILVLMCFAAAGDISYAVPLKLLAVAAALTLGFVLLIFSGATKRLKDPSLTAWQLIGACSIYLFGLLASPQIAYFFVINLFVPLSYGSLHFSQRMFALAWLGLSCVLGLAMMSISFYDGVALARPVDRLLFWLAVIIALGRFLAINAEVSRLRMNLQNKNSELTRATTKMNALASRDELTGLWNRREFMRLLQEESRRAVRNQSSFCVALIDIDHLKRVNDEYGHLTGDTVLHELAQFLEGMRRATDSLGRYGGEKFSLLLINARLSTGTVALERIRAQVNQQEWENIVPGLRVTISAGVAAWKPGETLTQVLNRADEALHDAKQAGRNCVRASQIT